MNGYVCFYNRQRVEVYADTMFAARDEAARILRVPPKKQYQINVLLAEKNGEQVTHTAD